MTRASFRSAAPWLLPALLIVAAGLWVYGPALHGGWIWDDVEEVTQNAALRDPGGLARIWLAPDGPDYFPLRSTVQWLEWQAWGGAPAGYHAVNLGLHLLSALLFWRLLGRLGVRSAWVGGLLLAVHPLAVESVAWIAELKNTLSLAWILLAMICYVDADDGRGRGRYGLSLGCFLLALLSKTSVVMFPAVILLYSWWRRQRIDRRDLRAAAPFFALSLVLGLVTLWFQHHRAILAGHEFAGGFATRIAAAGLALAFYLGKGLGPFGLLPVYPHWSLDPLTPWDFAPWLGWAALGWLCWRRRTTWGRAALLGLGFFALNLLPVLGLVGMAYLRISRVADHLAYLPLLGLLGLAAAALNRVPAAGRWALVAVAAIVLGGLARSRASIYRDEETFWTTALAGNPQAWVAEGNLGFALFQAGRVPEAIRHYEAALRLRPDYAEAHYNLGTAWLRLNRTGEAIAEYEAAVSLQPGSPGMQNNLATALAQAGRLPEAVAHFEAAVRLDPDYADAHHNLGNAYLVSRRLPEAIREYQVALRLRPDDAAARAGLEMAERALPLPAGR